MRSWRRDASVAQGVQLGQEFLADRFGSVMVDRSAKANSAKSVRRQAVGLEVEVVRQYDSLEGLLSSVSDRATSLVRDRHDLVLVPRPAFVTVDE